MAEKKGKRNGKPLVIVESPAKARTIGRFLGSDYVIEASIGHIRDLPEKRTQLPAELRKEDWAYLGVNVHRNFEPVYVVSPEKREQVRKLRELLKNASELYLATDEDREGEAISWHLKEVLQPKIPVRRMVFHEITRDAIQQALAHPRDIDDDLVRAQETRRILDRLYGYDVSPLLWRKLGGIARSAGRVQSVAVRLLVERERERMAFVSATYWDLQGRFARRDEAATFAATLVRVDGRKLPAAKDFDPATGKLLDPQVLLLDEAAAHALAQRLRGSTFRVAARDDKPYVSRPAAPFTTSTLQQEANRKLRFSAQRTMQAAQNLYQNGYITYMRTDSISLSREALDAARRIVQEQYGPDYLPAEPRVYQNKVKNAQEAHEAIRPAGTSFRLPSEVRDELSADEFKLYDLIWKRTVASQMADARGQQTTIALEASSAQGEVARFQASGKTIEFPGYLRAYVEGSDDPEAELADQETVLPDVAVGETVDCRALEPKSHATQPPPRYTEATLTRTLEQLGIGRPSTYATIIETIVDRGYVSKRGTALVPTWTAMAVARLMEQHFPDLVDYGFTARMEDELDAISRGEAGHVDYLRQFYYGHDREGLKHLLESKLSEIDVREVCRIPIGKPPPQTGQGPDDEIVVRVGKFGPYVEQGSRRARVPDDLAPDEVTVTKALELLDQAATADEALGICPETGKPVFLKTGRFGPYVQRGTVEDGEKPQNASLLRGMTPEDVDLEVALKLLSLPRTLGTHPESGEPVLAHNGRYGPYVQCGKETRSLPDELSPLEVTLEQALELLAQPKTTRRSFRQPAEPLRVFPPSPVTGEPIKLYSGRYGPYVTDGTTNASLPKGTLPEQLTFEQAVELLAVRAARGPARKRAQRRGSGASARQAKRAASGAAAPKASLRKKTPRKKSAK
jgi:DNA topoisomerase-1